jgi:hypothetical protein
MIDVTRIPFKDLCEDKNRARFGQLAGQNSLPHSGRPTKGFMGHVRLETKAKPARYARRQDFAAEPPYQPIEGLKKLPQPVDIA